MYFLRSVTLIKHDYNKLFKWTFSFSTNVVFCESKVEKEQKKQSIAWFNASNRK